MALNLLKKRRRYGPTIEIEPGEAPGAIDATPDLPPPNICVLAYGPEGFQEKNVTNIAGLKEYLAHWDVVWVHVTGLENQEKIREIGELFGLHLLALEDVVSLGQRPKVEEYEDNLFLVMQAAEMREHLEMEQLAVFLGGKFVVSFQPSTMNVLEPVMERLRQGKGRIRQMGPDYLLYSIVDSVVDHYFPILEQFGERLEDLEDEVVANPEDEIMAKIHHIKSELLVLRRTLWPFREVASALLSQDTTFINQATRPFLRDCHDHVIHAIDLVAAYREVGSSLSDMYLSALSNRMNEVMRVLTVIATIFIPLTFVAGIYGMNFNPSRSPYNMPELEWYYGYPLALLLMVAIALVMVIYFRRKKWF
jgi:magnesium transporter